MEADNPGGKTGGQVQIEGGIALEIMVNDAVHEEEEGVRQRPEAEHEVRTKYVEVGEGVEPHKDHEGTHQVAELEEKVVHALLTVLDEPEGQQNEQLGVQE